MPPSSKGQAAPAGPAPETRRQAKSGATRRRICEAAAAAIAADGYHRTSLANVVGRAGISIGALQHHYPAKEDLVTATAEYLLARSVKWFARAKEGLARDRKGFAEMIRRSWREQFMTHEYGALLEIMVAARTDDELRARLAPTLDGWRHAIEAELAALLPAPKDAARLETMLIISRAMMTGLLVHDDLLRDRRRMEKVIDQWIEIVGAGA